MAKKQKAKVYVRLRAKECRNGEQSLYLDIYKDGKRKYEFLENLKLLPETDALSKEHNRMVWAKAEKIKAERNAECAAARAMENVGKKKYDLMPLKELMDIYKEYKLKNGGGKSNQTLIHSASLYLMEYRPDARLKNIDKQFVSGFADFLKGTTKKDGKPLSKTSVYLYFKTLSIMLNFAVRKEYIQNNPISMMDAEEKPKNEKGTREFLTAEEVRMLIATPCARPMIKNAFLFSCFCGLRLSDIKNLEWEDIKNEDGKSVVRIFMQKTKEYLMAPLSENALSYLPEKNGSKVFTFPTDRRIEHWVDKWSKQAGIKKKVTFHVARHTFATLGLTANVPVTVVQKLLGHKNLSTTMIYAEVIDSKKEEAVNAISNLI